MAHVMRDLLSVAVVVAGTAGVTTALNASPAKGLAVAGALALICVAAMTRFPVANLGVACIVGFAFTASWDEVEVAGVNPRWAFLFVGLCLLAFVGALRRLPWIPWWVHSFGLTLIAATALSTLFPISPDYLNSRYLTSEIGVALGERPAVSKAFTYALVNVYLVPLGVMLAALVSRRALRWIIGAFVGGVALSSAAGYLCFIGAPWLADLLAEPIGPGFRAIGYTSHPLHLATSCVMALGLAFWTAVQTRPAVAYAGRAAVVAIVLGLYASGSRGGNVSAAVLIAACIVLIPRIRRRGHIVLSSVAALLGLLMLMAPEFVARALRTMRIIGDATTQASDTGREQLLHQAMADFAHSPIYGIGPRYIAEAHVLYAGILAGGGVLLFVGYLLFNIGSFRAALEARTIDRALAGALLATLLGSLCYWLVGDEFTVAPVHIVYGILVALLAVHANPAGPPTTSTLAEEPVSDVPRMIR